MRAIAAVCIALIASTPALSAQSVAVAPHLGTMGIGADVSVALTDEVSIRGGANFQLYSPEIDLSDVTYTLDLPSPSLGAILDVHPGGGGFRISVGAIYLASDLEVDGVLSEAVDIGDSTYAPADVGTLQGILITNSLAPYVGIGVGNAAHGASGFFLDVGAAFHGTPEVDLSATGPIATDAEFQVELERETADIEDDVEGFKVYPVLSLGFRFAVS